MSLIEKAKEFATKKHGKINQRRKYNNEPYINHPYRVAETVGVFIHDEEIIAVAYLHDTVEDTNTTVEELEREFGHNISHMVWELTNASKGSKENRATRKKIDNEKIQTISNNAKSIKLADIIDNVSDMDQAPEDFRQKYLREKQKQLSVLKGGNKTLMIIAEELIKKRLQ